MKIFNLFIFSLLIGACQSPSEKLVSENEALKDNVKGVRDDLKDISTKYFTERDSIEGLNSDLIKTQGYLKFSTELLTSNEALGKALYHHLFEDINTVEFLYNLSFLVNPGHQIEFESNEENQLIENSRLFYDTQFYLYYLWNHTHKDSENIKRIYNYNKEFGFKVLNSLTLEAHQELQDLVDALIVSYIEVHKDTIWLDEMYAKADTVNVLGDASYKAIYSQEVSQLLSKHGNYNAINYESWVYSFWVRRQHEGNAGAFFEIFQDLKKGMQDFDEDS